MRDARVHRPFPKKLWIRSLVAIVAIVVVGIVINRVEGGAASPIVWRLMAAAVVTAFVALAKVVAGTRAAAIAGVVGTAIAVALLILFA